VREPRPPRGQIWTATNLGPEIKLVEIRAPLTLLPGWIYCDPFLRFLHTIGPKNAAMITTLTFVGTAKLHHCRDYVCGDTCEWGMVSSMGLYSSFIKHFCKNLEKLVLQVHEDSIFFGDSQPFPGTPHGPINRPVTTEQAMKPLLQAKMKAIKSLKELVVIGSEKGIAFAEETVRWFKDRTRARNRFERDKQALDARVETEEKLVEKLRRPLAEFEMSGPGM